VSNAEPERLLASNLAQIEASFQAHTFVEIDRVLIRVHF